MVFVGVVIKYLKIKIKEITNSKRYGEQAVAIKLADSCLG